MTQTTPEISSFDDFRQLEIDKELVSWVKTQYEKLKLTRGPYERQWRLNYAFYKGRQNVEFTRTSLGGGAGGRLYTPSAPPYRVRAIRNRIKPIIRTEIAKFTSNKPNASVVPASNEDEDLFAAQAGEQVWEYVYSNKKIHQKFIEQAFWLAITGNGFIKDWWDSSAIVENNTDQPYQGDHQIEAVTPLHLFVPDLREVDIEKQPYVFNVYTRSVDWAKAFCATRGIVRDFNPSVVSANEVMGDSFFTQSSENDAKPDSVIVIEVWIKPNGHKYFPNGGMLTVVDTHLVNKYDEGLPYDHGDYPFTHFRHVLTGEFYGDSIINDLVDPQRGYNRTRSQIIEAKNRTSKPQWKAAKGSIDPSRITSEPGLIIEYLPGLDGPEPIALQSLPNYVLEELDREVVDMQDISAQHEISRGQTPPGVTAATAISFLQERDDTSLSPTFTSIEFGYEKIAKHVLSHVVQFWDTERVVRAAGQDGYFDAIALKGSDIKSGMDIKMEAGSALPTSKAAKQAFLMDLIKLGVIDPDKALSMMDMGGIDKLYEELKADERQAQRENLRMRSLEIQEIEAHYMEVEQAKAQYMPQMGMEDIDAFGMAPEELMSGMQDTQTGNPLIPPDNIVSVNSWDNHAVHIDIHNRFRKGQAFERLPQEIKDQFEAHVQMHAMALNQAAMQAQMMMPPMDPRNDPLGGADNGSGVPLGSNQFGPPGVEEGNPPPQGEM